MTYRDSVKGCINGGTITGNKSTFNNIVPEQKTEYDDNYRTDMDKSEMEQRLDGLDYSITVCEDTLEILRQKLVPITHHNRPSCDEEKMIESRKANAQCTEHLLSMERKVDNIVKTINELLQNIVL